MDDTEIGYRSALDLIEAYRAKQLSPVEVTEAVLRRLEAVEPRINAFVTVTPELALEQARAAEAAYVAGEAGPLAGVPFSLKDLTVTAGIRTARGSLVNPDWIPDEDGPMNERLYSAGGVMLGKTTTPELGWKGETTSPVTGTTHNPWKHGRTSGGSSGGAAAHVAAGVGPLAQGSDGAGSIRIPAGFCGVYGLKPSWGLVPLYPPSSPLSHNGPISRTVADAALFLDITAGSDPRDRLSIDANANYLDAARDGACAAGGERPLEGLRVAWSRDLGYAAVHEDVADIAEAAARRFEELGCTVEEAHPLEGDPWDILDVIWASRQAGGHMHDLDEVRNRLDPGRLRVIEQGQQLTAVQLANAETRHLAYAQSVREFFEDYDLLLTPTLPVAAFAAGEDFPAEIAGVPQSYLGWTAFTYPFNLTGQPAATAPAGFDGEGLPVGLQIVAPWRDDAACIRASAAFEAIAPWSDARPDLGV